MKKICFYLTTRGNYAKTKTIIDVLKDDPDVELQYILGGNYPEMDVFGEVRHINILKDGTQRTITRNAAIIAFEAGMYLEELKPDILVIVADRFECLPMAMTAYYMGIPIAHIEGGEVSGAIDDGIRHSITHLSTFHFPCTELSKERIKSFGIKENYIFNVGATSLDMLRLHKDQELEDWVEKPFLLMTLHPGKLSIRQVEWAFHITLWAIGALNINTYWLYPNIDSGSGLIVNELFKIKFPFVHVINTVRIEKYAAMLNQAACIVGNSSSGLREASFLGTPAVNIGFRQIDREHGANVVHAPFEERDIRKAVREQITHGKYEPDYTYGDGYSGERTAKVLQADLVMSHAA